MARTGYCPDCVGTEMPRMLKALRGKSLRSIDIEFVLHDSAQGSLFVNQAGFEQIAKLLESGVLKVEHGAGVLTAGQGARYEYTRDAVVSSNLAAGNNTIVHEAVHILQDIKRLRARTTEVESQAFVVQMVVWAKENAYAHGSEQKALQAFAAQKTHMGTAAKLVLAKGIGRGPRVRLTPGDLREVEAAVASDPLYRASANAVHTFDGIGTAVPLK